ncbi:MAG: transposase, partial [Simplicispira sp.]|nr:transposase [Simplicispira sp.]
MREIQGSRARPTAPTFRQNSSAASPEAVMAEVTAWCTPTGADIPGGVSSTLRVKTGEYAVVRNSGHLLRALGCCPTARATSWACGLRAPVAKFWMKVFNDLKTRGVGDILIAVTDGFEGHARGCQRCVPATTPLTRIVHPIRNSLTLRHGKTA